MSEVSPAAGKKKTVGLIKKEATRQESGHWQVHDAENPEGFQVSMLGDTEIETKQIETPPGRERPV